MSAVVAPFTFSFFFLHPLRSPGSSSGDGDAVPKIIVEEI